MWCDMWDATCEMWVMWGMWWDVVRCDVRGDWRCVWRWWREKLLEMWCEMLCEIWCVTWDVRCETRCAMWCVIGRRCDVWDVNDVGCEWCEWCDVSDVSGVSDVHDVVLLKLRNSAFDNSIAGSSAVLVLHGRKTPLSKTMQDEATWNPTLNWTSFPSGHRFGDFFRASKQRHIYCHRQKDRGTWQASIFQSQHKTRKHLSWPLRYWTKKTLMRITCASKTKWHGLYGHGMACWQTRFAHLGYAKSSEHETRKQARDKLWASPAALFRTQVWHALNINHLCTNLVCPGVDFLQNLSCWRQQTLTPSDRGIC